MRVLSSCTVPAEFLKPFHHAFCPHHSTQIILVKITHPSVPILLRKTYRWPVPTCRKTILRLRDIRLPTSLHILLYFLCWFSLKYSTLYAPQKSALGPLLFSLYHLITYHGNSFGFNCIAELILILISLSDNSAPILNLYTHRKWKHIRSYEIGSKSPQCLFSTIHHSSLLEVAIILT